MNENKRDFWWLQLRLLMLCVLALSVIAAARFVLPAQYEIAREYVEQINERSAREIYAPLFSVANKAGEYVSKQYDLLKDAVMSALEREQLPVILSGARLSEPLSLKYPLQSFTLSYGYGERIHPVNGQEDFHRGVDLAAEKGAGVTPVADGVVSVCGFNESLGNFVQLRHTNGLYSLYAHLNEIYVYPRMFVSCATVIGTVGSTGSSSGYHLHLELVRNGYYLDYLACVSENVV